MFNNIYIYTRHNLITMYIIKSTSNLKMFVLINTIVDEYWLPALAMHDVCQ